MTLKNNKIHKDVGINTLLDDAEFLNQNKEDINNRLMASMRRFDRMQHFVSSHSHSIQFTKDYHAQQRAVARLLKQYFLWLKDTHLEICDETEKQKWANLSFYEYQYSRMNKYNNAQKNLLANLSLYESQISFCGSDEANIEPLEIYKALSNKVDVKLIPLLFINNTLLDSNALREKIAAIGKGRLNFDKSALEFIDKNKQFLTWLIDFMDGDILDRNKTKLDNERIKKTLSNDETFTDNEESLFYTKQLLTQPRAILEVEAIINEKLIAKPHKNETKNNTLFSISNEKQQIKLNWLDDNEIINILRSANELLNQLDFIEKAINNDDESAKKASLIQAFCSNTAKIINERTKKLKKKIKEFKENPNIQTEGSLGNSCINLSCDINNLAPEINNVYQLAQDADRKTSIRKQEKGYQKLSESQLVRMFTPTKCQANTNDSQKDNNKVTTTETNTVTSRPQMDTQKTTQSETGNTAFFASVQNTHKPIHASQILSFLKTMTNMVSDFVSYLRHNIIRFEQKMSPFDTNSFTMFNTQQASNALKSYQQPFMNNKEILHFLK